MELIEDDNETIESDNDLEMMEDEISTATSPTPLLEAIIWKQGTIEDEIYPDHKHTMKIDLDQVKHMTNL